MILVFPERGDHGKSALVCVLPWNPPAEGKFRRAAAWQQLSGEHRRGGKRWPGLQNTKPCAEDGTGCAVGGVDFPPWL